VIYYKLAGNEHFDELFEIIYHTNDPGLRPVLDLTQLTWDQFGWLFRTTGQVYRILVDGCLAGFCWINIRSRVLQLRGLIVKSTFRGRGIGTRTLGWLEETFGGQVDQIELSVHASNPRAKALYERCGYVASGGCGPSGFYTMRKKIQPEAYAWPPG